MTPEQTLNQAIAAQRAGDTAAAIALYERVLQQQPDQIDALTLLGPLRHETGDATNAIALLTRATKLDPNHALAWYNLGLVLGDQPHSGKDAEAALLQAVKIAQHQQPFWVALGRQLLKNGNAKAAQAIFADLNKQQPNVEYLVLQAEAAAEQKEFIAAKAAATAAVELAHALPDDHARRQAMVDLNRYDHLLKDPTGQLRGAYLHLSLANADDALPYVQLARIYLAHSQYLLALAMLDKAVAIDPRSLEIRWLSTFAHALPIYSSQAQITQMLVAYEAKLHQLSAHIDSLNDAELIGTEYLPELLQPLFLAYNGEDIRHVQSLAGDILHKLLTRRYGEIALHSSSDRETRNNKTGDDRIRLAIVSETFYYHSNMKLRRSWLRRIDRTKFRLCLYHVGTITDLYTQEIAAMADEFHHIPHDFDATLAKLRADAPDIIQYTNIGLNTLTIKLAALRLAPVQATTWGHPITSGMPTIDYFLSSELMETPDAQNYYRERLVNLPGLSVVPEPIFNEKHFGDLQPRTRADYGIGEDDVFYLCLQSVNKYLPRHDALYAEIALKVPNSKFVFVEHAANPAISELFKLRLRGPFRARGLDPAAHLVFLPFQNQGGYSNLHRLADITLDSLEWSGANTTFEALELGGLLLTCPGRFMRGRHTAAILNCIGMPELIAADETIYLEKAIAWGLDPALRARLRADTAVALPNLYRDPGLGDALNKFYLDAHKKAQRK